MRASVPVNSLLNRPEQLLYGRLVRAFPGHVILSHVALGRLAAMPAVTVIADFVVCRADFTAVAVLDIDDPEASEPSRRRDRRQDGLLQAAGVKVIRVSARDLPHEAALKALVAAHPLNSSTEQLARKAS